MKLLIAADMEGISGVVHPDHVNPSHAEYARFRRNGCRSFRITTNPEALPRSNFPASHPPGRFPLPLIFL